MVLLASLLRSVSVPAWLSRVVKLAIMWVGMGTTLNSLVVSVRPGKRLFVISQVSVLFSRLLAKTNLPSVSV